MKTKMRLASVGLFAAFLGLLYGSNQLLAAENDTKATQWVFVGGEVTIPGRYFCPDDLTLGKAIKMAKGVTSRASDKVILTQQRSGKQTFTLKAVEKGDAADIKLKPGDKVFVPRKG